MAIDTTKPRTRRAILFSALGGAIAAGAAALSRANPVAAADDEPMLVGHQYSASHLTAITATGSNGFDGSSDSGVGVFGDSTSSDGVHGSSSSGNGVAGNSASSVGVFGHSDSNVGIYGYSQATDKPGVIGQSFGDRSGLQGYSGSGALPAAPAKTGVHGYANQDAHAMGVRAQSPKGRGLVASGGTAQLRLVPSLAASHPTSGATGDLFLDKSARLWLCIKGGNPAGWKRVSLV